MTRPVGQKGKTALLCVKKESLGGKKIAVLSTPIAPDHRTVVQKREKTSNCSKGDNATPLFRGGIRLDAKGEGASDCDTARRKKKERGTFTSYGLAQREV